MTHIYKHQLSWHKTDNRKFVQLPSHTDWFEYVSPSQLLEATADNSWKERWIAKVGKSEADRISSEARKRGTSEHTIVESTQNNDKLGSWYKDITYVGQELFTFAPLQCGRILAGFCDAVVKREGKLTAVDFKTARKPKKEEWITDYKIQVSCYAKMLYETYGYKCEGAEIAIMLPEGEPQMFFLNRRDIAMHLKLMEKRCGIRFK